MANPAPRSTINSTMGKSHLSSKVSGLFLGHVRSRLDSVSGDLYGFSVIAEFHNGGLGLPWG